LEDERVFAIRRLSTRLAAIYDQDWGANRREGYWALYLAWLHHDISGEAKDAAPKERRRAVKEMDELWGRRVTCGDLVQIARMHTCDLFDVVLLMPTITEDLVDMRRTLE
jgi:hypothetical protein